MNFVDDVATDDDIEEFDSEDGGDTAEHRDDVEEGEEAAAAGEREAAEDYSLARAIRGGGAGGEGGDCARAAVAVARVMIALKKRKLDTPRGDPLDASDFTSRERGRVAGSGGRHAAVDAGDDDGEGDDEDGVPSDDERDMDYDPERPEDEEEDEEEDEDDDVLAHLDYLFGSDDSASDPAESDAESDDGSQDADAGDEAAAAPPRRPEDVHARDDGGVYATPAEGDWLRAARKRASRKVRGRAYHQSRRADPPPRTLTPPDEGTRLVDFAGDLGAVTVAVVHEPVPGSIPGGGGAVLVEEGIPLGDALSRLRVGAPYQKRRPPRGDAGPEEEGGALTVDRWVEALDVVETVGDDLVVVVRDEERLDGRDPRERTAVDVTVSGVVEEEARQPSTAAGGAGGETAEGGEGASGSGAAAARGSGLGPGGDGFGDAFRDLLSLRVVPSTRWTVQILSGAERAVEFSAPALRLGLLARGAETLSRVAVRFFVEANRPPKPPEGAPRYFPHLIHGSIRARRELSRGALTVRKTRETLALATMFTEILGSCLEADGELAARAANNLVLHVAHASSDDLDADGVPTFAYVCQLDGKDDVLRFVLRACGEGRVSSAVDEDRHAHFPALLGLRRLGFAYEPSLGVSALRSPPSATELIELKKPPMDHRQREHLQISVTAMSSFAERRCERAFFFDLAGMTSEERPAVMHARIVGQKWEERILDLITSSESSRGGALIFHDMSKGTVPILDQVGMGQPREEEGAVPPPANQSINASLITFMSHLARDARQRRAGDPPGGQVPGAGKLFFLHKCTMQLSHDDMCDVFRLSATEAEQCKFGTFEPDFLHIQRAGEVWDITVIDAKASRKTMLRHAVQLELYRALIMKWLEVNNLTTHFRVSRRAGVWLMNEPWWTPVQDTDMKRSALIVKQLRSGENVNSLRSLIDAMVARPTDVQWRLERRCEICVYQGHCTSEAAGSVRALPDQSAEAQTVMQSFLGELSQQEGSEEDMEDMFSAVKKLPRHVSLYFSEGELAEETNTRIFDTESSSRGEGQGGAASRALALHPRPPGSLPAPPELQQPAAAGEPVDPDAVMLPQTSGRRFIFDHVEGVREARAVVVRGRGLLSRKEFVRGCIINRRHAFEGRLVVGIEQCDDEDRPHPTVVFVMDSRGIELTHDEHWMKHRILRFDEDERTETAEMEFRCGGETFRAKGTVRRRRQSSRSLREVSVEQNDFQSGDVNRLRLGNDGVYRVAVAREEILRCEGDAPQAVNLWEGQDGAAPASSSALSYVHMIDRIPAGMAAQLFRSRQKLSACTTGRVLPYASKHRAFPLFAEDVGVYLSINSDHHLGEAGSEYIFSWTVLVRFHAANVERVVSHSPKSKAPPHETLIEYIHALFAEISDHNAALQPEGDGEKPDVREFIKLHCYVFDPSELEALRACVLKSALQMSGGNPTAVGRLALDLVFCLNPSEDELLVEGEAASQEPSDADDSTAQRKRRPPVPAPEVLCVLNCLRESLAFPTVVGLQLADAERAFGLSMGHTSFDLATLRDIYAHSGPTSGKFARAAEKRLLTADRVVRAMRDFIRYSVRSAPPNFVRPFHMAKATSIDDVCLRHLEFVRNHEMSLERDDVRRPRLKRLEESVSGGEVARLILVEVQTESVKEPIIEEGDDPGGILCRAINQSGPKVGQRCAYRAHEESAFCKRHKNAGQLLTRARATFTCVNPDSLYNFIGGDEFGIFVEESEEGINLATQFRDAAYASTPCPDRVQNDIPLAFARLVSQHDARGNAVLEIAWHRSHMNLAGDSAAMRGRRFLLYGRHISMVRFSQEKCMRLVREDKMNQHPETLRVCDATGVSATQAVGFFNAPDEKSWRAVQSTLRRTLSGEPAPRSSEDEQIAVLRREEEAIRASRVVTPFTESQFNAYASVMRRQLTVIHGPPGTGKTECLAGILYRYAARLSPSETPQEKAKANVNFVCLSAFTKAAIVHVLAKSKPHPAMPMLCLFSNYNDARNHEKFLPAHVCIFVKKNNSVFKFHGIGGAIQPGGQQPLAPGDADVKLTDWLVQVRERPETGAVCICGTAWQVQSAITDKTVAPIVKDGLALTIFDEASQVPLLDAAAVLRHVNRAHGRIVSCGDHKQLPPVRKGNYPVPDELTVASRRVARRLTRWRCVPGMHVAGIVPENFGLVVKVIGPNRQGEGRGFKGIVVSMKECTGTQARGHDEEFQYADFAPLLSYQRYDWSMHEHVEALLRSTTDGASEICQLGENFRMSAALVDFHRREDLYTHRYHAHDSIASRRLEVDWSDARYDDLLRAMAGVDPHELEPLRQILDPESATTVVLLQNFSPREMSRRSAGGIEATLVAALSRLLFESTPADERRSFWGNALFLVTPRNQQRHTMLRALAQYHSTDNAAPLPAAEGFLPSDGSPAGTVEKRQGAEADTAIVCYGQVSPEEVARNSGFYFNMNRLNVSLTRARRKRILLLSAAMLEPQSVPVDNPRAAQAFFYLQDFVRSVRDSREGGAVVDIDARSASWLRRLCEAGEGRLSDGEVHDGRRTRRRAENQA